MGEDRRNEERQAKNRREYAQAVKSQIVQREEERIEARKDFFREGEQLDEEARQRYDPLNVTQHKYQSCLLDRCFLQR